MKFLGAEVVNDVVGHDALDKDCEHKGDDYEKSRKEHGHSDMKFVTSSTSSASVKKFLARVKLSRGNAQSVFVPKV